MADNILPNTPEPPVKKKSKARVSALAVFFVIILTVVLIILGERLMMDLNEWFNPAYDYRNSARMVPTYSYDESGATSTAKTYTQIEYQAYRLGVHTLFVIPVLLGGVLLYLSFYRKPDNPKRLIAWPYLLFSLWMIVHLVGEAMYYLVELSEKLGLYIVLLILTVLLTWLVLLIQRKWHERQQLQS